MKTHSVFNRYKLLGDIKWCLNWRNGWVRIYNTSISWNTDWTIHYTFFSVEQISRVIVKC